MKLSGRIKSAQHSERFLLLAFLVTALIAAQVSIRTALTNTPRPQLNENAGPLHTLAAPHFSLTGGFQSVLTLNNKGPEPLIVQPVIFGSLGDRLEVAPIAIEKNSFRMFDLKQWAEGAGNSFQEGSLQVLYRGKDSVLGAQIKVYNSSSSLIFDDQLRELSGAADSRSLEGVWWRPTKECQIEISLNNTTEAPLSLALHIEGTAPAQKDSFDFVLKPHEMRLVDVDQELVGKTGGTLLETGGISIQYLGAKTALLAQVTVRDAALGYSSVVHLFEPLAAKSSELQGAGIRLGEVAGEELLPMIVARNVGSVSSTLTGKIQCTTSDGKTSDILLRDVNLLAGEIKLLDLTAAIKRGRLGNIESAGLQFNYSTEPGSVIVSALSTSRSLNQVFQVPMVDPAAEYSSTGTYPWNITEDASTVIYIKNVTARPQQYVLHLSYDSSPQGSEGGCYQPGLRTIAPGQTDVIDIVKLRDHRVPDAESRIIAQDAWQGQVHWSLRSGENKSLIGRAEEVSVSKQISSNFTSQECCPDTYVRSSATPSPATKAVGGTQQFVATVVYKDCFGNEWPNIVNGPWVSSDASVATVNSYSGLATAIGPGTADIKVTTTDSYWVPDGFGGCLQSPFMHTITAIFNVIKIIIKQDGTDITNTTHSVIVGQKISLIGEVQPSGTSFTNPHWSVPGKVIANYIASLSQGTVTPLTNLSASTLDFYWVDAGLGRQVQYSVKVNNTTFTAVATFDVQSPSFTVTATPGVIDIRLEDTGCWLRLGTPTVHGMDFYRSPIPPGFSGSTEWVQIAYPGAWYKDNNNICKQLSGPGLDNQYPYGTDPTDQDSPGVSLNDTIQQTTANDDFDMWLLYKPAAANSIWVPIKKVHWGWSAAASRNGSGCSAWTKTSALVKPITISDSTDHPQWTQLANITNYIQVPCQ